MSGQTLLAVDPGGRCGWAVRTAAGVGASGVWDLTPPRGSSPGVRYLLLRARLHEALAAYPDLRLVVYELSHHRGGAATEYAAGYSTHIQAWVAELQLQGRVIDHHAVHSGTLKRLATGRGNAGKSEMLAEAQRRWPGHTFASDDEADARLLAAVTLPVVG